MTPHGPEPVCPRPHLAADPPDNQPPPKEDQQSEEDPRREEWPEWGDKDHPPPIKK
jgi:hypothetical protein